MAFLSIGQATLLFSVELNLIIDIVIKTTSIAKSISDEPIVPKLSPPLSSGFVSKSPKVAPNGLVKTNANQNKTTIDILVKQ